MSIRDRIVADIKEAMKAGHSEKVSALRFVQAAIKNQEIEVRPRELTDEDVLGVLKKSVKQRRESIEQYEQAGRQDLADKEKAEVALLEVYLPEMLSEEQTQELVNEVVQDLGAQSVKDMGRVMKEVLARAGGLADGKLVSQLVKARLSSG